MDDYFQDLDPANAASGETPRTPEPPHQAAAPERSIRNVNINSSPARPRPRMDMGEPPRNAAGTITAPAPMPLRPPRRGRMWMWVIAGIAVIILVILGIMATRPTTVTITPRTLDVSFNAGQSIAAAPMASQSTGALTYAVQTLTADDSASLKTNGTEHAETKATGQVTLRNDYSAAPIKLVKDTRLQSPDGHIFKIRDMVVIPGKKGTVAGEVTALVYADKAGADYNLGPTAKFTIPGLKGSKEYDSVYATSATAMSGGFAGNRPSVAASDLQKAQADLRASVEKALREKAAALAGTATVVFPDLMKITYTEGMQPGDNGTATLKEQGTAIVPVFTASDFAAYIGSTINAGVQGASVQFIPQQGFSAAYAPEASTTELGAGTVTLNLSGTGRIVWNIDTASISSALAGKPKASFQDIVKNFAAIEKATARVMPFWRSTFPEDPSDIQIKVEAPSSKT